MLLAMEDDNNKIIGYTDDITAGGELNAMKMVRQTSPDWPEIWLLSGFSKDC